jgi:endonuclease/exonuclease/phosphatase family metal-dependent hydrolase
MHHGTLTKQVAQGLKVLRQRIADADPKVPPSKLDETLNLATWNVREFGKKPRLDASLHFIAEIIGQFDLVALVEVRDNVADLGQVMRYLGPYWRVVFSDYLTDAGGNRERIAYVYDHRAVTFTGLASSALPSRNQAGDEYLSKISWWRNPYIASFRAGSFDFILVTAHIRWGKTEKGRIPELRMLADWVATRSDEQYLGDKDIVVMGDFNVPDEESDLFKAVTGRGLRMPAALMGKHGSNLAKDKRYDQILHDPKHVRSFTGMGGVLDFYQGDHRALFPGTTLTKQKFTYEISDHLPLWIHVETDTEDEKLDQILNPKK